MTKVHTLAEAALLLVASGNADNVDMPTPFRRRCPVDLVGGVAQGDETKRTDLCIKCLFRLRR